MIYGNLCAGIMKCKYTGSHFGIQIYSRHTHFVIDKKYIIYVSMGICTYFYYISPISRVVRKLPLYLFLTYIF